MEFKFQPIGKFVISLPDNIGAQEVVQGLYYFKAESIAYEPIVHMHKYAKNQQNTFPIS